MGKREERGRDEKKNCSGAGGIGTLPENVYEDRVRGAAAGVSRGVLSVFEPGVDDSAARRAGDRAVFGFAAARADDGAGGGRCVVVIADLPAAHAEGPGGSVSRVRKIAQDAAAGAEDEGRAGASGSAASRGRKV